MIRVPRVLFDWLDLPKSLAIIAVVGGGYAFLVWRVYAHGGSPFGVLAAAPFVALALAPPLIALFPGYVGWIDQRTWTPWQGRYYAFDDHQVRVVEARGDLWFSSADVHAALGLKRRAGVLGAMRAAERRDDPEAGEVLSHAGLVRLLGTSTDRTTLRLLAWADRDVRRQWQKKRDAHLPVAEPAVTVATTAAPVTGAATTPPPRSPIRGDDGS